jgi:hypothetical protein
LGANCTTTSPGAKLRRAKTPRPAMALSWKSTVAMLNMRLTCLDFAIGRST